MSSPTQAREVPYDNHGGRDYEHHWIGGFCTTTIEGPASTRIYPPSPQPVRLNDLGFGLGAGAVANFFLVMRFRTAMSERRLLVFVTPNQMANLIIVLSSGRKTRRLS